MDSNIDPVIKQYIEDISNCSSGGGLVQTRIDSHFYSYQDDKRFAKLWSKRLAAAVTGITGTNAETLLAKERLINAKSKVVSSKLTPRATAKQNQRSSSQQYRESGSIVSDNTSTPGLFVEHERDAELLTVAQAEKMAKKKLRSKSNSKK